MRIRVCWPSLYVYVFRLSFDTLSSRISFVVHNYYIIAYTLDCGTLIENEVCGADGGGGGIGANTV